MLIYSYYDVQSIRIKFCNFLINSANLTGFLINNRIRLMSLLNSKNIVILGFIAILAMSFFMLYAMPMDKDGRMVNCPFMNGSTGFCQMTLADHMNLWQQFFSTTKVKDILLVVLSLFAFLFSILLATNLLTYYQLKSQSLRHYLYRYHPELKLFDYLALAFSDGLIHSKIYA